MNDSKNCLSYCVGDCVFSNFYYSVRRSIYMAVRSSEPYSVDTSVFEYPVFSVSYLGLRKFTEKFIIENYAN